MFALRYIAEHDKKDIAKKTPRLSLFQKCSLHRIIDVAGAAGGRKDTQVMSSSSHVHVLYKI